MSSDPLHVDTIELRMNAHKLELHAADLKEEHDAAHRAMSDAQTGFGSGASARSLSARIALWEKETRSDHADLMGHAARHLTAATKYETSEDHNWHRFDKLGEKLPPSGTV